MSTAVADRPDEQPTMTTPALRAKVLIRGAWFTAHPATPVPEARAEVDALITAIEAEAGEDLTTAYMVGYEKGRAEVAEYQRRVRNFAAAWHIANGHEYASVDTCSWSTCLGLLTGRITKGEDLEAAEAEASK